MVLLQVPIICAGVQGIFLLGRQRVLCLCKECAARPHEKDREHSCTQFEQHAGAGAAKKWKSSLRIQPGSIPEVPAGESLAPLHLPCLSSATQIILNPQAGSP